MAELIYGYLSGLITALLALSVDNIGLKILFGAFGVFFVILLDLMLYQRRVRNDRR